RKHRVAAIDESAGVLRDDAALVVSDRVRQRDRADDLPDAVLAGVDSRSAVAERCHPVGANADAVVVVRDVAFVLTSCSGVAADDVASVRDADRRHAALIATNPDAVRYGGRTGDVRADVVGGDDRAGTSRDADAFIQVAGDVVPDALSGAADRRIRRPEQRNARRIRNGRVAVPVEADVVALNFVTGADLNRNPLRMVLQG